jgi:ribulose-phosphate 3-epimerase
MKGLPPGWFAELPVNRLVVEVSLWSADLGRLAEDIARVDALTDIYHLDVADGHFSPMLLFFPDLVAAIRKLSRRPLHVHLMATDDILLDQIAQFAEAGADIISVHVENGVVNEALSLIDELRLVPGIVLQLQTPVSDASPYLDRARVLTLLGTCIGVKGQALAPQAEARLREARHLVSQNASAQRTVLTADGGIREHTVPGLRLAGADAVVLGSLAFGAPDPAERIAWLHTLPQDIDQ